MEFTSYNGDSRNRIVRLNEDGSIDNTFNVGTGFNGGVTSIAIQPDGKILVVGGFTSYQGNTANRIIRLNADGSIDATFNTGSGFNITAMTVVLQPDNKILVGGFFTDYNGNTRNRIIRLNSNGSIDNSFNIGSGFDALGVLSIALQADGKILAGGGFTSYNTHTPNRIVRLFNCPFNVSISPTNVNDGMVGLPYDPVSFSQTGLTGTITWSISSGTLPPGLTLNSSTGVLSGTPTIAGNYNFTIQASNGSCSVTANYSITILPAAPRVQVDNTVLDFGEVPLMQSSIREITIKNVGALPLQITAIPATKEVFKYGFIGFETIAPGQSRKFSLYFTPTEAQTYNDIYTIISNAIGTPSTISVTGKGVVVNSITNYQPICEVYPNPTQDYLKVRFKQSSEFEVSVADVNGKICLKEKSYTPEKILDLRKLGKGIYFLQIFTNNESQRVKFVKM
ncbi:MAG: T9SS type A sorting domain-containing protein [Raineya sp.]|nr:T9SS type A sorting domain-containing protein [Raineya sp.]